MKPTNHLQDYYNHLKNTDSILHEFTKDAICVELGCTIHSYRKKITKPQSFSPAEQKAIAIVYKLPFHFLFPSQSK